MNRRAFLRATTALAGTALVPTWLTPKPRHRVNLGAFCGHSFRYSLDTPFAQESGPFGLTTFATDARICLAVPGDESAKEGTEEKRPKAFGLSWTHDDGTGWQRWPAQQYLLAEYSSCPHCYQSEGYLRIPDGKGGWNCGGQCVACRGTGYGTYPGIQPIGGIHIAKEQDEKIRRELRDVEYRIDKSRYPHEDKRAFQAIQFRFDGGLGIMMPVDPVRVKERLATASPRG